MRLRKTLSLALAVSVAASILTAVPAAAAAVPTDKYTCTLSDKVGTQTETIEFEDHGGAQAYEVVLVKPNSTVAVTPKEKMSATVRAYDKSGDYSGTVMWTIDGSEKDATEIEANKTATAVFAKNFWGLANPYYILTIGDGSNQTTIVYKLSDGAATPTAPTTPTAPETKPAPTAPATKPVPTAPAAKPTEGTVSNAKGTYTVQKGDTLAMIALNNYGSYADRTKIYNANKDLFKKTKDRLTPGMTLVLPSQGLLPVLKAENGNTIYTVKAGDTLGKISAHYYGSANKYTKIDRKSVV